MCSSVSSFALPLTTLTESAAPPPAVVVTAPARARAASSCVARWRGCEVLSRLAGEWDGPSYALLTRNCCSCVRSVVVRSSFDRRSSIVVVVSRDGSGDTPPPPTRATLGRIAHARARTHP